MGAATISAAVWISGPYGRVGLDAWLGTPSKSPLAAFCYFQGENRALTRNYKVEISKHSPRALV